jgi:hypothetical protein
MEAETSEPFEVRNRFVRRRVCMLKPCKDEMMSKNSHNPDSTDQALNQNNQMSDDPGDGSRKSFVTGRDGGKTAAEKAPDQDEQDQSTIKAFGEEGAGIASKE